MKCGDANNPAGPFIKSNGQCCRRDVKPGFTRCNLHGGASPASKIKAEQMMAQCRLPAIEVLFSIIEQFESNICPMCNYPKGDTDEKRMIVKTCQTVLDRAGMGPHQVLEISRQLDGDINLDALLPEEKGDLLALLAQIREIKARAKTRQTTMVSDPTSALKDAGNTVQ